MRSSCASPLVHDKQEYSAEADYANQYGHKNRIVECVSAGIGIIDRTKQFECVHPVINESGIARSVKHEFFKWLDEELRIKVLAVDLPVHLAVGIDNRRLRQVVEALGRREKLKTHVPADGCHGRLVRTQEVPTRRIDSFGGCIHAHSVGRVDLPVETDADDGKRVITQGLVGDLEVFFDIGGDQGANVVATCIDEADDQWLATERLQWKRLALDVPKRVVAYRLTNGALADCQSGLTVIVLLRRSRRPYPEEDKGAEYCSKTVGCSLSA